MERNLQWASGLLDEMELVYEKAEKEESLKNELYQLEEQALSEAADACAEGGLFSVEVGKVLTRKQFDEMADIDKETAIVMLSQKGLSIFSIDRNSATIIVKLSPQILKTAASTIFGLLNRLEKLDGAAQVTSSNWNMKLLVPQGGKKGLFRWEMLIMQLYPWISIQETAANETVANETAEKPIQPKMSFWERMKEWVGRFFRRS